MKTNVLSAAALALAAPALAQGETTTDKPTVEIVSRGADGVPDVVQVDGQTYKVCKGDVQDSCINPRTAGLNFGARDLQYWPGRPASEISAPLPATPPATAIVEQDTPLPG